MRAVLLALTIVAAVLVTGAARAHGMRSAYVEIVESPSGAATISLHAQVPIAGIRISAERPCALARADGAADAEGVQILTCPGSIARARIVLDGLGPIVSEAVVFTSLASGTSASSLATPAHPSVTLPSGDSAWVPVARQYVRLGVAHILSGADHLLFLLGVVLVLRRIRAVLIAETAFTMSHSITFSASALGLVHVSAPAVEACIAASLVLVALEAADVVKGRDVPIREGAGLAFVFGLVHGLGFAGGLAEIGLPDRAIPAALVGFAAGVEVGQVAFLTVVLGLFAIAGSAPRAERAFVTLATYAVGGVGCFWFFERLRALLVHLA